MPTLLDRTHSDRAAGGSELERVVQQVVQQLRQQQRVASREQDARQLDAPALAAAGGAIVNIVDIHAEIPMKNYVVYVAAKGGLLALTRSLARELGPEVRVNGIAPGWVDTPGLAASLPRFRGLVGPLLRTPEQGADTIGWLAADDRAAESSGEFWLDRAPRTRHRLSRTRAADTAERRARLWAWCEAVSGWSLPAAL